MMKLRLLKGVMLSALLIASAGASAQVVYFTGDFDISNWAIVDNPANPGPSSDANVDISGAPETIIFNGNNSGAGDNCCSMWDDLEITVPSDGCISFDYTYDNPDWDYFYYAVNGVATPVWTSGGVTTGQIYVTLTAGDVFAFRIQTHDDCCGMGQLTVSNFGFHEDLGAGVPPADPMPDVVAACGLEVDIPIGFDCEGNMVPSTGDPLVYDTPGTYTINWTWTDFDGATITLPQNITIEDNEAPVADVDPLPTLASCNVTLVPPTATDACGGGTTVTATTTDPTFYDEDGFYSVTWTYDDGAGNISTQTQDIVISNPVKGSGVVMHATGSGTGSIDYSVSGSYIAPLEFDWDNDGTGDFDDTEDLSALDAGTYIVTVRDAFGCEDIDTFTVLDQLSVEELSVYFDIYPNPTDRLFQVKTNSHDFMGSPLFVTNTLGEIIYTATIQNQLTKMDLGEFESGIYFISVGENRQNIGRIVKR